MRQACSGLTNRDMPLYCASPDILSDARTAVRDRDGHYGAAAVSRLDYQAPAAHHAESLTDVFESGMRAGLSGSGEQRADIHIKDPGGGYSRKRAL